jgi:hypothetical protein
MTGGIGRRQVLAGLAATTTATAARTGPPAVPPVDEGIAARHGIEYRALPRAVVGVDVERLITVRTPADVVARRARLVRHVWKGAGPPTRLPRVEPGAALPVRLPHRGRADALVVPLRYGLTSTVFHVRPPGAWNRRLAVYHNGHGEPPDTMARTVGALLDHGYAVLVCAMPLMHWNPRSVEDPVTGRKTPVGSHDALARWDSPGFSPLTFFLDPVAVALNHAVAAYRPAEVHMVGLSGGGWTTTVYAALDPRITRSYPVAGSLPAYLRESAPLPPSSRGDWEQRTPGLYGIAGYLDLYVLAATAPARRQLQVLNRFDPCCFAGVGHRSYAPAVAHRAAVLGGRWDVLDDATHEQHTVSPYAVETILGDALSAGPPASATRSAGAGAGR